MKKEADHSDDFLTTLTRAVPFGILVIDFEGKITFANRRALGYFDTDLGLSTIVGTPLPKIIGRFNELSLRVQKYLANGWKEFNIEGNIEHTTYLMFRGRKIKTGVVVTIQNITASKESKYAALSSLLEGQEQERKRLAREIHDGIGPTLSTLKMNLANIQRDIQGMDQNLNQKFQRSYQMIDDAADDLRTISHNLMPKVLSDFGLVEAIDSLCDKIDEAGLRVEFISTGLEERLHKVSELGLYRITQELINNTLKYGAANKITVQLIKRDNGIRLMYEDDGKGFDLSSTSKGLGLMNIENRAKALAGGVILDSQPKQGMTAIVDIPTS
ncbi:MAG: sensor histidine kinase [Cyclobacteriaceae bacterium]